MGVEKSRNKKWECLARGHQLQTDVYPDTSFNKDTNKSSFSGTGDTFAIHKRIRMEEDSDSLFVRETTTIALLKIMNCLAWNMHGVLGKNVHSVNLLSEWNPTLVFLSETKVLNYRCHNCIYRLNLRVIFLWIVFRSWGMMLFMAWQYWYQYPILFVGHIDCIVKQNLNQWRFTGFYGNHVVSNREYSWQLIRQLVGIYELQNLLSLVGGDFNEIFF